MGSNQLASVTLGAAGLVSAGLALGVWWQTCALENKITVLQASVAVDDAARDAHANLIAEKRARLEEQQELEALPGRIKEARLQIAAIRHRLAAAAEASKAQQTAAPNGRPGDLASFDTMPTPTNQPPPVYPPKLQATGTTGTVIVDFVVDKGGCVRNSKVMSFTNAGFVDAALNAVNAWTFAPARKSGVPVAAHMQVPIVFLLNGPPQSPGQSAEQSGPQEWFPLQA